MNRAISINLGGLFFHIEEEAYHYLESYLDSIGSHFAGEQGSNEMLEDIEARVAEMFQEGLKKHKREVVLLSDVKMMTNTMGLPEQFDDPALESKYVGNYEEQEYDRFDRSKGRFSLRRNRSNNSFGGKRLYRNGDEKVLGGVASGLTAYFGIADPIWFRILFALSIFGGYGIVLYFLLWFIVPEAHTESQRLQMNGEKVTVSKLEKAIRKKHKQCKKEIKELKALKEERDRRRKYQYEFEV